MEFLVINSHYIYVNGKNYLAGTHFFQDTTLHECFVLWAYIYIYYKELPVLNGSFIHPFLYLSTYSFIHSFNSLAKYLLDCWLGNIDEFFLNRTHFLVVEMTVLR